jgi:hypothetical protein
LSFLGVFFWEIHSEVRRIPANQKKEKRNRRDGVVAALPVPREGIRKGTASLFKSDSSSLSLLLPLTKLLDLHERGAKVRGRKIEKESKKKNQTIHYRQEQITH